MSETTGTAPIHTTGRGGAGNIGPDPHEYTDGSIVREGIQGVGEPEFSTGRGGAGNIVEGAIPAGRTSQEVIPDVNKIPAEGHEDFHTGRGGAANVHKEKYGGHTKDPSRLSFIDKAKAFVKGKMDKKKEEPKVAEPTTTTTTV